MRITSRTLIAWTMVLVVVSSVAGRSAHGSEPLPGLLAVELTVKDPAQFEAYGAKTRAILAAHKGTPLFRASNPIGLFGEPRHRVLIGFRFPSKAAIKAFYSSPDYQALIPQRTAAADAVFTAYEIAQEGPTEEMRALLAVNFTVKDAARFGEYGEASRPIVQAHGGKLFLRAINPDGLAGEQPHKALVLFKFPEQRAVRAFYASEAYQKLIPLRSAGADMAFTGYDL